MSTAPVCSSNQPGRMTKSDRILLGAIAGAHGIRGDVIVKSFAETPEGVASYGPLQSKDGKRQFTLTVRNVTPKGVVARVSGVSDRNAAEALKGTELYVERSALPAADEGAFYHADLVGLDAVAPDGTVVGKVVAVHNFGAGDLLDIALAGSKRTEMIPFTDAFVPTVDLPARRVTVVLPPEDKDEEAPTPEEDLED